MKANELRIGNLVQYGTHIVKLKSIKYNGHVETDPVLDGFIQEYSPIELTPEILEKAGFWLVAKFEYRKGKMIVQVLDYEGAKGFNFFIGGEFIGQHNHVHQLQNLIHSLTGEELEINL